MAIFSASFLKEHLGDFQGHKIVDFQRKKEVLQRWLHSLGEGKVDAEKEIAMKGTFVNDFFGQVLGYAFNNAGTWLMQQEQKSETDGTRCDAAFGYFSLVDGQISGEVRMVAEFKNSSSDLEAKQKGRAGELSAVEQAFLYAGKSRGFCNWVVVCNVREIRFYHYSSQADFQSFLLKDLFSEDLLVELVFLFHAEHLLSREGTSRTDKLFQLSRKKEILSVSGNLHVLDEIYNLLRKFEGLPFIDPVFLARQYPFNVLGYRVWHYTRGVLHTTNPAIYHLLEGIEVQEDKSIVLSESLAAALEVAVTEPLIKLHYVFERLNKCLVFYLTAVKDLDEVVRRNRHVLGFPLAHNTGFSKDYGIIRYINVRVDEQCSCVSCLYRDLDYKGLIGRLAGFHPDDIDLEYAFGKHLLRAERNDGIYYALEKLEGRYKGDDRRIAEYMRVKMNLKSLTSRTDGSTAKGKRIKSRLEAMDLDSVLAYEVDLFAPAQLKAYLMEMKDSVLIERIAREAVYCKVQTRKMMEYLLRGDHMDAFDQVEQLDYCGWMLYQYNLTNFLMIDQWSTTREIHLDIFQAYVYSFLTPGVGLKKFDEQILTDAVLNIHASKLEEVLANVAVLAVTPETRKAMLTKVSNLLRSHVQTGGFAGLRLDPDMQAKMMDFTSKMAHFEVFRSLFVVIGKMDYAVDDFRTVVPDILNFLKADPDYWDQYMKPLSWLIEEYGAAFSPAGFLGVLEVIIPKIEVHKVKYGKIFKAVCRSWDRHFPREKITDAKLIGQAVLNHMNGGYAEYRQLGCLYQITAPGLKGSIISEFERYLEQGEFSGQLFEYLVHDRVLEYDHKGYFTFYVKDQLAHHPKGGYYLIGDQKFPSFMIHNLAIVVHRFGVPYDHPALSLVIDLIAYERWLMNPEGFDYDVFEVLWLKEVSSPHLLEKLRGNPFVRSAIERYLRDQNDSAVAEVYFKYILES